MTKPCFFFFLSVVGEKERTNDTVNVRTRDNKVHGEYSIADVISKFEELAATRVINSEDWGKKEDGEAAAAEAEKKE